MVKRQDISPQSEISFNLSEESFKPELRPEIERLNFSSKGELTCAIMLHRYLNLPIIDGVTFQRPMAHGTKADFFLPEQKVILEFHPIIFSHEFKTAEAYYIFSKALSRLRESDRAGIYQSLHREFRDRYFWIRNLHRRYSEDSEVKNSEVVIVENAEELYDKIIKPHSENALSRLEFVSEFKEVFQNAKRYEKEFRI